jgi:hypothetical protein
MPAPDGPPGTGPGRRNQPDLRYHAERDPPPLVGVLAIDTALRCRVQAPSPSLTSICGLLQAAALCYHASPRWPLAHLYLPGDISPAVEKPLRKKCTVAGWHLAVRQSGYTWPTSFCSQASQAYFQAGDTAARVAEQPWPRPLGRDPTHHLSPLEKGVSK